MVSAARKSRSKRIKPIRIVAIGSSAGSIRCLLQVFAELPLIPNCCVLMVVHLFPRGKSLLPQILRRSTRWKVKRAEDSAPIHTGIVYVAPPDLHLVLSKNRLHLLSSSPVRLQRGPSGSSIRLSRRLCDPRELDCAEDLIALCTG